MRVIISTHVGLVALAATSGQAAPPTITAQTYRKWHKTPPQHVSQGQVIGLVGCTGLCFGDHLHFEVRINGAVTNPLSYLG
jgi:hypothetical protein